MRRMERPAVPVAAISHPGMKRRGNEDRFGVFAYRQHPPFSLPVVLLVLCDGVGGHRAGEVAAEIAVEQIDAAVAASDGLNPPQILRQAIQQASEAIRQQAEQNPDQIGMGATCACAWIAGRRLYTATVGDSRIYLIRDGKAHRLSIDHTWVQEALEQGILKPDEVEGHPNQHVIRRYLGSPQIPEVDLRLCWDEAPAQNDAQRLENQGLLLQDGDLVLLTSDGLTDLVSDGEIAATFTSQPPREALSRLVEIANTRGGFDNITMVAAHIPPAQYREEATRPLKTHTPSRSRRSREWLGWLGVILLLLGVAAIAGWYLIGGVQPPPVTPTVTAVASPQAVPATSPSPPSTATSSPPTATPETLSSPTAQSGAAPTFTPWPTRLLP
ncbi:MULTISPECIES: protein phosphatase 2C domain-containing protein [Anaerolinea]|uniref:protein phosphatase 2C domain-containing protein n=1 Tax=Anaerolinea TaxID=233189 RepID=UPI002637E726|nr:protein phosphatase 2C domain-containing protein [Anaerolinea thermophila]